MIGADHAERDEKVGHSRQVINCVSFLAFDEIADRIATHCRKGDQLIVIARVRSHVWTGSEGEGRSGPVFIVTDFRFDAMHGPGSFGEFCL